MWVGSVLTMYTVESIQRGKRNFWSDREFIYNLVVVGMIDFALATVASMKLPDQVRIGVAAAATLAISMATHVATGKEINWDRIIYDTAYVSTYSLYKSKILYANGSRFIIEKFGIGSSILRTGVMTGMSALSNITGNVPYAITARLWIEKPQAYNSFSVIAGLESDEPIENLPKN